MIDEKNDALLGVKIREVQENWFPKSFNTTLVSNFIKKVTPTRVLYCELCEILRPLFYRTYSEDCFCY